ncbi:MAG: Probable metallo-hydrolase YflN, partial [uncultured Gemmatimonadetes bacterium]
GYEYLAGDPRCGGAADGDREPVLLRRARGRGPGVGAGGRGDSRVGAVDRVGGEGAVRRRAAGVHRPHPRPLRPRGGAAHAGRAVGRADLRAPAGASLPGRPRVVSAARPHRGRRGDGAHVAPVPARPLRLPAAPAHPPRRRVGAGDAGVAVDPHAGPLAGPRRPLPRRGPHAARGRRLRDDEAGVHDGGDAVAPGGQRPARVLHAGLGRRPPLGGGARRPGAGGGGHRPRPAPPRRSHARRPAHARQRLRDARHSGRWPLRARAGRVRRGGRHLGAAAGARPGDAGRRAGTVRARRRSDRSGAAQAL